MTINGSLSFTVSSRDGPTFAFIDADNMKHQFEVSLIRRKVLRDHLHVFDINKLFWFSHADRYYIFSAVEKNREPAEWLRDLRATSNCIFKSGQLTTNRSGKKQQGVDVMLAIEASRNAFYGNLSNCILYSGDGDMLPLVEMVVDTGKSITVVSFGDPEKSEVASSLRDAADSFIHVGSHLLKSCIKDEHRFQGISNVSIEQLQASGKEVKVSLDPGSNCYFELEGGSVYLVWSVDADLMSGSPRAAAFGSILGAKAYLSLSGPLNW